jgi:hypothetical protein
LLEFTGVDSFLVETMQEDYDVESSSEVHQEYEEGEVLQDAELVCVNQEDMDRIDAAEGILLNLFRSKCLFAGYSFLLEEAADNEFSSPNYSHQKAKRKDLLRYHVIKFKKLL